jgi:hypothetical protein
MATISSAYKINGVIDTAQSVYKNIQNIANASGCWFTYDIHAGKWAVIINTTGSSVASFTDSNIIGSINVSGKGVRELYNRVVVEFPHEDILDQKDYTEYAIDDADLFPNEAENTLNFSSELVNKPEQAQRLALQELKQSRVDKVIEFRTDYSKLGLKAGDLIDITSSMLDYTNKIFRITTVSEEDGDDNSIVIAITALEYDSTVYDYTSVFRQVRDRANGIIVKTINTAVAAEEDKGMGSQLLRMLGASMVTGLLNSVFTRNPLTGKVTQTLSPANAAVEKVLINTKTPAVTISGASTICENSTLTLTIALADPTCYCMLDTSTYEFDYTITGVNASDINKSLTGKVKVGSFAIGINDLSADKTLVLTIGSVSKSIGLGNSLSFTYSTTASPTSVTEGASSTVTLTTTGVANGTSVPYVISGSTSRISTALTGSVTVNSNSASLTINTIDDGAYQGNGSITVTFNESQADNCNQLDKTAAITIVDNDSPPPQDYQRTYVQLPAVWQGTYDVGDDQLKSVAVQRYAYMPVPFTGESTVNIPTTVSVTKGNPSTITVLTTTPIATAANIGGTDINVITTFNTVAPKALITGTRTTISGYY